MFGKLSMLASVPLFLALIAGALIPLQAASNGALGRELGHSLWAALTSLLLSTVVLIATLIALRVSQPNIAGALKGPWWLWIGGLSGAFYVAMATVLPAKIGASNFILSVIVGQVVIAMLIDHFGLLGLATQPINLMRVAGVVIILCGLMVVQVGSSKTSAGFDNTVQTAAASSRLK